MPPVVPPLANPSFVHRCAPTPRRPHRRGLRLWPLLIVAAALTACGGGGSSSAAGDSSAGPTVPGAAPTISTQPVDAQVTSGSTASFRVTAGGDGLQYQWQRSSDGGGSWQDIAGAVAATLALPGVTAADDGAQLRVRVSSGAAVVYSSVARLTVRAAATAAQITVAPASTQVSAGSEARFTVTASGTDLVYRWQWSSDGVTWADWIDGVGVSGAASAGLSLASPTVDMDGRLLRVLIRNTVGSLASDPVTLRVAAVTALPAIVSQPTAVTVTAGATARFAVRVTGQPAPNLQWQRSRDSGASFVDIDGATTASLALAGTTLADEGSLLRVVARNSAGSATSEAVALHVAAALVLPAFTAQPTDVSVNAAQAARFAVSATGNPAPDYQWQLSTDGGSTYTNINGSTAATLSFTAASTDNGRRYRVVARNSQGSTTSRAALLTVSAPASVLQGRGWVTASGNPALPAIAGLGGAAIDDQGNVTHLVLDQTGVLASDHRARLVAIRSQAGGASTTPSIGAAELVDATEPGGGILYATLRASPNGNLLAWWARNAACTASTYKTSGNCNYIVASRRLAGASAWEAPVVITAMETPAFDATINDRGDVVGFYLGIDPAADLGYFAAVAWRAADATGFTTRRWAFSVLSSAPADSFLPSNVALAADGSFLLAGQRTLGEEDVTVLSGDVRSGLTSAAVLDQRVNAPTYQGLWANASGAAVVAWTQDNGSRATTYAATRDAVDGVWRVTDTGVPPQPTDSVRATVTDGGDFIWYALNRCSSLRRRAGAWLPESALPAPLCGSLTDRSTVIARNGHLMQVQTLTGSTAAGRWASYDAERAALVNDYTSATSGAGYVLGTPGYLKGSLALSASGIAAWASINTYTDLPSATAPNGDGPGQPRFWLRYFK